MITTLCCFTTLPKIWFLYPIISSDARTRHKNSRLNWKKVQLPCKKKKYDN